MRIISIINQKGGCGKTTSSINLAACLARLGQKTLLVDMDPQGHCGIGLAVPEEQIERTIYDALIEPSDGRQAKLSEVVWQIASDFDLAPSTIQLAAFEQVFAGRPGREDRLTKALESMRETYDWVILDCPPSVGLLTFNALKASDQVIVPVETGFFSLHGLTKMMQTLETLKQRANRDILIRVLPTLYDTRTKLAREVLSELRLKFRDYLMESVVNFNTKLKEAASFGQPITEYDPGSRGYKDFVNLARELMGHRPLDVEAATGEKLSRPAELVQRARQLSQLTNFQFGRNVPATLPIGAISGSGNSASGNGARFSDSRIAGGGASADELEDASHGMLPSIAGASLSLESPEFNAGGGSAGSTGLAASRITSDQSAAAPTTAPQAPSVTTSVITPAITPVMMPAMVMAGQAAESGELELRALASARQGGGFEGVRLGTAAVTAGSGVIVASAASISSPSLSSQTQSAGAVGGSSSLPAGKPSSTFGRISDQKSAHRTAQRVGGAEPGAGPLPASLQKSANRLTGEMATEIGPMTSRPNLSLPPNRSPAGSAQAAQKTTIQKLQDFYGVKQVGEEIYFVARFRNAKRVLIAGDFNNWVAAVTPMQGDEKSGEWRMRLPLSPGRYRYRFVVDGRWVTDPHNKHVEVNQFGELNNVVEVARVA